MTRIEILQLTNDLNIANQTNNYEGLLKYLTQEEINSIEELSLDKIKHIIAERISCNELNIEDIISLLNSFGETSLDTPYRIDTNRTINLRDIVKNMSYKEQQYYAKDILYAIRYLLPGRINFIWKEFNPDVQKQYMDYALELFNHNGYICNFIIQTSPAVVKKFTITEAKKYINIIKNQKNDDDRIHYLANFINGLSPEVTEQNLEELLEIIKQEKIDLYLFFSGSDISDRTNNSLCKIFTKNPASILKVFKDDLEIVEELIEIYLYNVGFTRIFNKSVSKTDKEIAELVKESILKHSESQSEKDAIMNYIRKNGNSCISIILWLGIPEFKKALNDEELIEIYFLLENNQASVSIEDTFPEDFFKNNISKIIEKKKANGRALDDIANTIINQRKEIIELVDDEIIISIMNNSKDYEKLAFYCAMKDELKQNYFDELYNKIINNWKGFDKTNNSNIDMSQADTLKRLIERTPKSMLANLSLEQWRQIINLDYYKEIYGFQDYYEYIPEEFRLVFIREHLKALEGQELYEYESYFSRFKDNILKPIQDEIFAGNSQILKVYAFRGLTPEEITDEILLTVLDPEEKDISNSKRVRRYKTLQKLNANINQNLEPEILCDEIYTNLNIKVILRLTSQLKIQQKLISFKDDPFVINLIKKISLEKENWLEWIAYAFESEHTSMIEILRSVSNGDYTKITPKHIENCMKISLNGDNYYNIKTLEELENYDNIKYQKCSDILIDFTACKKICETGIIPLYERPRDEQKLFAIYQILFGMDFKSAENLIKKYGYITNKINYSTLTDQERDTLNTLSLMIEIYYKTDFDEIIETILNNPDLVKEKTKTVPVSIDMETSLINIYKKMYQKEIYQTPVEIDNQTLIELDGIEHSIPVIEIKPNEKDEYDFKMFIRSEGAYDPKWQEPENFKDSINRPDITYHGNCKSLISNQLLALPKSKGPILGYSSCDLQLAAPWDIVSASANQNLSIIKSSWSLGRGVQFMPPQDMINYTRHGHNEFVSDRLKYNEKTGTYEKEMPDYIIWIQETLVETNQEREQNPKWQQTKKAAAQIGVPIVVVNREAIVISEEKIILDNLKRLSNIDQNTNIKELLSNIITRFENNVVGLQFCEELKTKYFTSEDREKIYATINSILDNYYNTNQKLYYQIITVLYELLKEEAAKFKSNNGSTVGKVNDKVLKELKKYEKLIPTEPEFKTEAILS